MIISQYLQSPIDTIKIEIENLGKPYLSEYPELSFNISHSGQTTFMVFGRNCHLGVDIEYWKPIEFLDIARHFFHETEYQKLVKCDSERTEAFFNCWTRKEAYIKAIGAGLSEPLSKFEVSLLPEENPQILSPQHVRDSWKVFDVSDRQLHYSAAVAVNRKIQQIEFFDLSDVLDLLNSGEHCS